MMDEGHYVSTEYYWDYEDNEYILDAFWFYERNYPEAPDLWILKDLEVVDQEPNTPELDTGEQSVMFAKIDSTTPDNPQRYEDY